MNCSFGIQYSSHAARLILRLSSLVNRGVSKRLSFVVVGFSPECLLASAINHTLSPR